MSAFQSNKLRNTSESKKKRKLMKNQIAVLIPRWNQKENQRISIIFEYSHFLSNIKKKSTVSESMNGETDEMLDSLESKKESKKPNKL